MPTKLIDERLATELSPLVPEWPTGYSMEAGSSVVESGLQDERRLRVVGRV